MSFRAGQFESCCDLKAQIMSSYTRSGLDTVGQLGGGACFTKPGPQFGKTHLPTNKCRMHTTAVLAGIQWALQTRKKVSRGTKMSLELEIASRFLVDWLMAAEDEVEGQKNEDQEKIAGKAAATPLTTTQASSQPVASSVILRKFKRLLSFVKQYATKLEQTNATTSVAPSKSTINNAEGSCPAAASLDRLLPRPCLSEWSRKQLLQELQKNTIVYLENIVALIAENKNTDPTHGQLLFTFVVDCGRYFNKECSGTLPPGEVSKIRQAALHAGAFVIFRCAHEDSADLCEVRFPGVDASEARTILFMERMRDTTVEEVEFLWQVNKSLSNESLRQNFFTPSYLANKDPGLFWTLVRHASNLYLPAEDMAGLKSAGMFQPESRAVVSPATGASGSGSSSTGDAANDGSTSQKYKQNEEKLQAYLEALDAYGGHRSGAPSTSSQPGQELQDKQTVSKIFSWNSFLPGIRGGSLHRFALMTSAESDITSSTSSRREADRRELVKQNLNPEFPDEKCTKLVVAIVRACASPEFFGRLPNYKKEKKMGVCVLEREEEKQGNYGQQMTADFERQKMLQDLVKKNPALLKLLDTKDDKGFEKLLASNPQLKPVIEALGDKLQSVGPKEDKFPKTGNSTWSPAPDSKTAVKLMGQSRVCWHCQNVESERDKHTWVTCGKCGVATYCAATHQALHWEEHQEECAYFCAQSGTGSSSFTEPEAEGQLITTDEKRKLDRLVPVMVLPANEAVKPYVRYLPKDPAAARKRIKQLLNCEHLVEGNSFRGFVPSIGRTPGCNNEESIPGKRFYNTEFWLVQEDFSKHLKGAEVKISGLTGNTALNNRRGYLTGAYKSPVGHPGKAKDRYAVRLVKGSGSGGRTSSTSSAELEADTKLISGQNLSFTNSKVVEKFAKPNLHKQNARASALLTASNNVAAPPEFASQSNAMSSAMPITNYMHIGDESELAVRARGDVYMIRVGKMMPSKSDSAAGINNSAGSGGSASAARRGQQPPVDPFYTAASSSPQALNTEQVLQFLNGAGILGDDVKDEMVEPEEEIVNNENNKKQLLPFDRALYDRFCGMFNLIPLTDRFAISMLMKNDAEGERMVASAMQPMLELGATATAASTTRASGSCRGGAASASTTASSSTGKAKSKAAPHVKVTKEEIDKIGQDIADINLQPPEEEPDSVIGARVRMVDVENAPEHNGRVGKVLEVLDPVDSAAASLSNHVFGGVPVRAGPQYRIELQKTKTKPATVITTVKTSCIFD
ncbi:unnamed protein product [Amoebophrya sp. A120]|nr:unnamed protein product [Amoebophrya sp. A120]|eukprot:GSA120T00012653001.1